MSAAIVGTIAPRNRCEPWCAARSRPANDPSTPTQQKQSTVTATLTTGRASTTRARYHTRLAHTTTAMTTGKAAVPRQYAAATAPAEPTTP